jgi:hypothetical protein
MGSRPPTTMFASPQGRGDRSRPSAAGRRPSGGFRLPPGARFDPAAVCSLLIYPPTDEWRRARGGGLRAKSPDPAKPVCMGFPRSGLTATHHQGRLAASAPRLGAAHPRHPGPPPTAHPVPQRAHPTPSPPTLYPADRMAHPARPPYTRPAYPTPRRPDTTRYHPQLAYPTPGAPTLHPAGQIPPPTSLPYTHPGQHTECPLRLPHPTATLPPHPARACY